MSDFKALTTLPHFPELYCRGATFKGRGGRATGGKGRRGGREERRGEGICGTNVKLLPTRLYDNFNSFRQS